MRLPSPTPEDTARIARALARAVDETGLVLCLQGPLGAGKTHFAKGVAEGLGLPPERVTSPTFVLAQELPLAGGRRLVHVDCYRVGGEDELLAAGLLDWLAPGVLLMVEWADRVPGAWPADQLRVRIARGADDDAGRSAGADAGRRIEAAAGGPASAALLDRWRAGLRTTGEEARARRAIGAEAQ